MQNTSQHTRKKEKTYTALYVKSGAWYAGYIAEVPGVNTQGKTLREAKDNLTEALALILSAQRDLLAKHIGRKRVVMDELTVAV